MSLQTRFKGMFENCVSDKRIFQLELDNSTQTEHIPQRTASLTKTNLGPPSHKVLKANNKIIKVKGATSRFVYFEEIG